MDIAEGNFHCQNNTVDIASGMGFVSRFLVCRNSCHEIYNGG